MPEVTTPLAPSEDTIRILLTTDNHVGYKENDPIIGDDAWKTFDEIMNIAKERDVDMVLQSGDLFHVNKPSKQSLFQVLRILRLYCLGSRPCELELLSDPSETFDDGFNTVNYEDPNINISIPMFAISGNHDDSSGNSLLSPMDLLHVSGFINHFGRVLKNDDITITPILMQKGTTKLALYGLASVLDERLFRTFRDGGVKFKTPNVRKDEWFNLMAVHQNHTPHTETSYLPETFLPSFLDLVVWGHEHECIPYTVTNYEAGFETLQPGSSVATSLSDKEANEKNVFILSIKNRDYHIEPIKLKTIRPFVMKDLSLADSGIIAGPTSKAEVTRYLRGKVEELIEDAKRKWKEQNPEVFAVEADDEQTASQIKNSENDTNDPRYPLPLIRLRVDYSGGYEVENPRRFSNMFVGKVANVNDIILFHRKRDTSKNKEKNIKLKDIQVEENASIKVQSFVNGFLRESSLSLLPEIGINAAVKNFVDKEDKQALESFVQQELKNDIKLLTKAQIEENGQLVNYIKHHKKSFLSNNPNTNVDQLVSKAPRAAVDVLFDSDDNETPITKKAKFAEIASDSDEPALKPKAKARTTRKRARKEVEIEDSYDEADKDVEVVSSEDEYVPPKKKTTRSRKQDEQIVVSSEEDEQKSSKKSTSRGAAKTTRGSRRGRGGRGGKTTSNSKKGPPLSIASLLSQFGR